MSSKNLDWSKLVDQEVTVSGTAQNGKAGPLLMTGPDDAILIRGMDQWDAATVGQEVTVDAVVRRVPGYPAADDSGEAMQGTASGEDTWVLELKDHRLGSAD